MNDLIYHQVQQGDDEWKTLRPNYKTASEASVIMGCSPKTTRSEAIRLKATGTEKEYSQWVEEVLFPRGHKVEALARPLVEAMIGEDLYPAVVSRGDWLASLDGFTMDARLISEIKQWNEAKAADVREGKLPEEDRWQVVHQLAVTRAEKCLYVVSDGTESKTVTLWVSPNEEDFKALAIGWAQFDADVAAYAPTEVVPAVVGRAPESLPALRIEVQGMVTASNLAEFKAVALAAIAKVSNNLQTDQDFADAEKAVKWAKEIEDRVDGAKNHALSQTASIDELFRALDEIKAAARDMRLQQEKLLVTRKQEIRDGILLAAKAEWAEFLEKLNKTVGKLTVPAVAPDLAAAMKGKRTLDTLRDAASTALAKAKIEAHQLADHIRASVEILRDEAKGYEGLFADAQQLVGKPHDDLRATIKVRVAEHQKAEADRLERERAKIRAEEEAKARAAVEAEAKAKAEVERIAQLDQRREQARPETEVEQLRREGTRAANAVAPAAKVAPPFAPEVTDLTPTAAEIVRVLAGHYQVTEEVVSGWLSNMEFSPARGRKIAGSL